MSTRQESRRRFLKAVPAAVAGAVATKVYAQGRGGPVGPVNADAVKAAETLDGVKFTSEEEARIAGGANGFLNSYNQLRQVTITQETEPAYIFRPSMPGKAPKGPATPGAPIKYTKAPAGLKRPANVEDVAFWPVTHLAALIQRKLVTSTELTEMYLTRLKRYQPKLNFYVTLTEDLARKQAAQADAEIKAGKYRGPLHGIPWGAKDLYATKGIRTTWGGELYVDQVFDYDCTVVERLTAAGAVLIAKLTLGTLAQGDQWFGGQTKSPWDPTLQRGSSGSSAGPGSATGAGCVAFSMGTETRGSILSPSTNNGVVGLRPTYGRVSRHGAMALSTTMDKCGPMCRYAEDTILVLNAIYGPDAYDPSVADAALAWNPDAPLAGFRIAYVKTAFENAGRIGGAGRGGPGGGAAGGGAGGRGAAAPTAEQQAAADAMKKMYDDVLATYTKLGAKLEAVDLPDLSLTNPLSFILDVEASASFDDVTRSGDINQIAAPAVSRSTWPNTFRQARFVPAVEYIRAMRARTLLQRTFDGFMSQYDALLEVGTGGTLSTTNLTGHPAMAVKCGISMVNNNANPPVAIPTPRMLMLTGKLYDEGTLVRIAMAFEQATEWKDRHPTLA
jgi:Asp-tRNA(Asn)/Glu-tRNA(Gln) amidotransferase A subunit family amidase